MPASGRRGRTSRNSSAPGARPISHLSSISTTTGSLPIRSRRARTGRWFWTCFPGCTESSQGQDTGSCIPTRAGSTRGLPTGRDSRNTGSYSRCRERGTAWTTARRRTFSPRGRRRCSTDTKKSSAAPRNSRSPSTNTWTGTTTKE